jgi:hypothetical protein
MIKQNDQKIIKNFFLSINYQKTVDKYYFCIQIYLYMDIIEEEIEIIKFRATKFV